jgi:seryl-tRNA synthetase
MRKIGADLPYHDDILTQIGGWNHDAAVAMSGNRFSILTGHVARLERALVQYFLDFHSSRGYTEVSVPYIVSQSTLKGTGHLPKFEEDLFKIANHEAGAGEPVYLIPTGEVPVTALYRDQILDAHQLPLKHVCYTPCFRAEAGSYGRDSRGILRQHQFHKVELVKICSPETSAEEHEDMVADVEALLKSLELPHRRVMLCSGDTGFAARICYDLEVWMPGQQKFREISSVSNCYEFQARRLGMRFRSTSHTGAEMGSNSSKAKSSVANSKTGSTKVLPHTLNGSGVAVGR